MTEQAQAVEGRQAAGGGGMAPGEDKLSGEDKRPGAGGGAAYDAVIVGASLAGCTAATLLGRAGLRVALVERSPDQTAFKRICTHYIQSSAVPTLERLDVLEELEQMGARRSRARLWSRWGWIMPPRRPEVPAGVNIRRERLDPFLRRLAAETPGVELILGVAAEELLRDGDGAVSGVVVRNREGARNALRAPLSIGADGRDSTIAKLSGVRTRRLPHGRFAYAAYYEGPPVAGDPDSSLWLLDPSMAGAFPTDEGLTLYACMPTLDRLPEFRRDLEQGLERFVSEIPDAPPILESRRVTPVAGRLDMTNVLRSPIAPGLALIGDAALALDPLWGIGCGFALQMADWLADAVMPALAGEQPLSQGLAAYRRRQRAGLREHAAMIVDYATGRKLNAAERLIFSAAAREPRLAATFEAFGTRNLAPRRFLVGALPRALASRARHAVRPGARPSLSRSNPVEATL
jgi:menaquinone-9 beta-reductase